MSTPKSCINPKTGRPITVGGKIWGQLLHDHIIEGDIVAPANELFVADSREEAKFAVKLISKQNPAPRGYINKVDNTGKRVIRARRRLTQKQMENYMVECTTKVVIQEKDNVNDMSEEKVNDYLSEKILNMMLSDGKISTKDLDRFTLAKAAPESESESASESESESESD
jgi:hypothetical protein